jgi:phosphosulfolactate synthase
MLEVGCRYVITEGRESGTAGIYRSSGEVRTGLVSDIIDQIGAEKLIFEAPNSGSQNFFITQIGANVNLGNVSPRDLVRLEAQRVGLRNETFFVGTR